MAEQINKVKVKVMGDDYTIKGDANPEYIEQLAAMLNERMGRMMQENPHLTRVQVAVLTALNLADEYAKLQKDYKQFVEIFKQEN